MATETEVRSVLNAYAIAKNAHDVDAILAVCHPQASYESVGLPGRVEGLDALRAFYTAFFKALPDYRGDFDGEAIAGNTAVVWGRFSGTVEGEFMGLPATGRRIEVPVTFVCTFEHGLLKSDVGYFDAGRRFEQAGVEPPTPAAAFVERFADAWSAPTPERLVALVDCKSTFLYPFMTEPVDRDGLRDYFANALTAMPDLRLEVRRWAAHGDDVLIEWSAGATVGGEQVEWDGADRFSFDGERVVEARSYYDTEPIRAALSAPAAA
jgi:steroid delta-isomerase-like uncharacterized protein